MFDHALVLHEPDPEEDLAQIAQLLVFYDRVTVMGLGPQLSQLVRRMGVDGAAKLAADGRLELAVLENRDFFGPPTRLNGLGRISWAFHDDDATYSENILREAGAIADHSIMLGKALRLIPFGQGGSATDSFDVALGILSETGKGDSIARRFVEARFPEHTLPSNFYFRLLPEPNGSEWRFETNLDAEALSKLGTRMAGRRMHCGPHMVVNALVAAVGQTLAASLVKGDLAPRRHVDPLAQMLVSDAVRKVVPSGEIAMFEEIALDGAGSIGRAITSGGKSFMDLAQLLERKERFSSWLKGVPADLNIGREYVHYLRDGSWLDRFSGKAARCALFTAAGLVVGAIAAGPVGAAAGAGLGVFDGLLLDRIVDGWRPNRFVEGPLAEFTRGSPAQ